MDCILLGLYKPAKDAPSETTEISLSKFKGISVFYDVVNSDFRTEKRLQKISKLFLKSNALWWGDSFSEEEGGREGEGRVREGEGIGRGREMEREEEREGEGGERSGEDG